MSNTKGIEPRMAAYRALVEIDRGAPSDIALDKVVREFKLSELDKALTWAIVLIDLRNRDFMDKAIDVFIHQNKIPYIARRVIRIGFSQIHFMDRIPPHAAVSTSVSLMKKLKKPSLAGLVNGILHKMLQLDVNDIPMPEKPIDKTAIENSHPGWLVRKWKKQYQEEFAIELIKSNNFEPPLYLRLNIQKTSRRNLIKLFTEEEIEISIVENFPEYLRVESSGKPSKLPGFTEGYFSIQDPAFSIPVDLMDIFPGDKVLEIGCAPGGKITHIAERYGNTIDITGIDISTERIEMARENLERLDLTGMVELRVEDFLTSTIDDKYDAILIDAPCTSLGVIRRHPEIRYRRKPRDFKKMSELQHGLIEKGVDLLKEDGRLVYCVCSNETEEAEAHLRKLPPGVELSIPKDEYPKNYYSKNIIKTFPNIHNLDGMSTFRLQRAK